MDVKTGPLMQMFTEADNYTQDLFRWLACVAIIIGLGLAVFTVVWKGQPFDMQQYGIGVGVLFVGMGAAVRLKAEIPGTSTATTTVTTTAPTPQPTGMAGA
jgi:hypothetical protein